MATRYKAQRKITNQLLDMTLITQERLFRDVARSIVNDLPIEKVKQLFNLKMIEGSNNELDIAYRNNDYQMLEQLRSLINEDCSMITGEITIHDE